MLLIITVARVSFSILGVLQWNIVAGLQHTKIPLTEMACVRVSILPTLPKIGTWPQVHEMADL